MEKNSPKKPTVIAIAAVSGGGKTTVAKGLSQELGKTEILFLDDYDFQGPSHMMEWIDNGCDPEDWDLTPLVSELQELLRRPLDFIMLDYPFAYLHRQVKESIDFSIFIDTPLDVAMARRLIRDGQSAETIVSEMKNYLTRGRKGYLNLLQTTKPYSDLIVDGTPPVQEIVTNITHHLERVNRN